VGHSMSYFGSTEFLLEVAKGKIDGHRIAFIPAFGDISTTETLIWRHGGAYTFNDTAATLYLSSSDNTDTQDVRIVWLDANYEEQTSLVTLQGHTLVTIGTGLRVNEIYTLDSTSTAGDVYVANANNHTNGVPNNQAEIVATFDSDAQVRQMGLYTVPAGYTVFGVGEIYFSSPKGRDNDFFWNTRNPTTPTPTLKTNVTSIYQSTVAIELSYSPLPEKTDVFFTANTSTGSGHVTMSCPILIVDNTKL